MMPNAPVALRVAIDLMHLPSRVRSIRSGSLPDGVPTVLRIAAGDQEAIGRAAQSMCRSHEELREAAAFYVEQILLYPGADSYRVLGTTPEASYSELRHNMAQLLRWLHPDHNCKDQRNVFAARVTRAWNDLKTKERRAAYDRQRRLKANLDEGPASQAPLNRHWPTQQSNYSGAYRGRLVTRQFSQMYPHQTGGILRRILLLLFGRSAL